MNYRASTLSARLLRAGVPAATVATLVPGDVTGPQTALEAYVTTHSDPAIATAYGPGGTGPGIPAPPSQPIGPTPADNGLLAWTYDPAAAINTSATALASGVLTLARLRLDRVVTVASALLTVTTAGAGLTAGQSRVGLYTAAGTLLAASADQAAAWASTGNKTVPLVAVSGQSLTSLPPGAYYLALLCNGTTPPALARSTSQVSINAGLAAGSYRHATIGSGLTALPATLAMGGQAASSTAVWAAVA